MKRPLGVILAGGLSARMGGGDKALQDLGGRPVLAHVIGRLAPQVADLALNANGDPARFARFGLPVLADPVAGHPGPLAGILAGLDWAAARGADSIVTAAADTPFFPCDLVPRLLLAGEGMAQPLVLAASRDAAGALLQPTFGLWPVALRAELRAALGRGTRKVRRWAEEHGARVAEFPVVRFDPFFNVNTPEDLERARELLGG
ncbi:MAG: molybdenum cofactor guanylyltransferase MobA [Pseudodonghicola sp.]